MILASFLVLLVAAIGTLSVLARASKETALGAMGYVAFAVGIGVALVACSAELQGVLLAWAFDVI